MPSHRRSVSQPDTLPVYDNIETLEYNLYVKADNTSRPGPSNRKKPSPAAKKSSIAAPKASAVRSRRSSLPGNKMPVQEAKEDPAPVGDKKFPFLRRSSVAMKPQEINFNKVESRTDCWLKRENHTQGRISALSSSPDAIRGYENSSMEEENKSPDMPARPATSCELRHPGPRNTYSMDPYIPVRPTSS